MIEGSFADLCRNQYLHADVKLYTSIPSTGLAEQTNGIIRRLYRVVHTQDRYLTRTAQQ